MDPDDVPPDVPRETPNLPARPRAFSTPELEAVIRRAVELQTGSTERSEDISEAEVVRIGQELGLEPAAVRRAMAEVRGRPVETSDRLSVVGPATVRASRVLRRPAEDVATAVARLLRDREFMVAQRRFPDRTRYVRDSSIAAGMGRIARTFTTSYRPLNLKQLDVSVSPLDASSCHIEVSHDMSGARAGLAAGVMGSGGGLATLWAAMVWATPIADPLMLLGIPALGGAWFGMRGIYSTMSRSVEDKLEALLDKLEHEDIG
jgi:hypothetical protein